MSTNDNDNGNGNDNNDNDNDNKDPDGPTRTPQNQPQRWFPLESNPDLMNSYIEKLGFNTNLYHFVDVFSTEDWALSMIPQPVVAVLCLYPPTTAALRNHRNDDDTAGIAIPQQHDSDNDDVWFIRQRIGNACGTIGLLHALLNVGPAPNDGARPGLWFHPDSWLAQFQTACPRTLDPSTKADILERDARIAALHEQTAASPRNATPRGNSVHDKVDLHFVALVLGGRRQRHRRCGDGDGDDNGDGDDGNPYDVLYELDGRQANPVAHGPSCPETLLRDACRVVESFMRRDPQEVRFTILALAPRSA